MNKTQKIRAKRWIYRLELLQSQMQEMVCKIEDRMSRRPEEYVESKNGRLEQEELNTLLDALNSVDAAIDYLNLIDLPDTQ